MPLDIDYYIKIIVTGGYQLVSKIHMHEVKVETHQYTWSFSTSALHIMVLMVVTMHSLIILYISECSVRMTMRFIINYVCI